MEIINDLSLSLMTGKTNLQKLQPAPENSHQENSGQTAEIMEQAVSANQNLAEVIKMLGFKASPDNINLASNLVMNNLPVTKENLLKFNQALKLTGDTQQALFLLQNGLKINSKNAEIIKGISSHELQLLTDLEEVASLIENLPEGELKSSLLEILTGKGTQAPSQTNTQSLQQQSAAEQATQPPPPAEVPEQSAQHAQNAAPEQDTPLPSQADSATPKQANPETPQAPEIKNADKPPETQQNPAHGTSPNRQTSSLPMMKKDILLAEIPEHTDKSSSALKNEDSTLEILSQNSKKPLEENRPTTPPEMRLQEDEKTLPFKSSSIMGKLIEKFSINPEKDNLDDLDERLNELKKTMENAKQHLSENDQADKTLYDKFDKINRSLDFFHDMKKMIYMQFPVMIKDKELNAELYVFKDKTKKQTKSQKSQSALLSLDFAYLGHFEAYIQKNGQAVNIRFKTPDDTKDLITQNISTLASRLENKGFRLEGYSFNKENQPFSILSKEPIDDSQANNANSSLTYINIKA